MIEPVGFNIQAFNPRNHVIKRAKEGVMIGGTLGAFQGYFDESLNTGKKSKLANGIKMAYLGGVILGITGIIISLGEIGQKKAARKPCSVSR